MPRSRGLSRPDTARLKSTLDRLPPQLSPLRAPILALARQNQDLLTCGQADPTALDAALATFADRPAAAEAFADWLAAVPDTNAPWAGPLAFAQGYLAGVDLFADPEAPPPPPLPPEPEGLQRLQVPTPPKFKTKIGPRCLELKNRDIHIFVIELNDWECDAEREKFDAAASDGLPADVTSPHLRWEQDDDFKSGEISGRRWIARSVATGVPVQSHYFVTLRGVHFTADFISRKHPGIDITPYESLLAGIRLR